MAMARSVVWAGPIVLWRSTAASTMRVLVWSCSSARRRCWYFLVISLYHHDDSILTKPGRLGSLRLFRIHIWLANRHQEDPMATLDVFPPPDQVIARLGALPGARLSPGAVFAVDGQAPSGPEQASAVLVLQTTLVDADAAA